MSDKNTPEYRVCAWLGSAYDRFKKMREQGIDMNGLPAINIALKNLEENGKLTVGSVGYLFSRSHPEGSLKEYNKYKNYHLKYGNILECPLQDLIDSNLVDWQSGRHNVMPVDLARAIAKDTDYEWKNDQLKRKPMQVVQGLFE